jgi:hypothetical protein
MHKEIGSIFINNRIIEENKNPLEIDLTDVNGERVNIKTKENIYANLYLVDRQVYDLNYIITSTNNL